MPKVIIDIGHLGNDSGAVANNLREDLLNKYVASYVVPELERHGVIVVTTTGTLQNRINIEHVEKPNYFISLHTNAGKGDGFEVFCYSRGGESERLAKLIHDEILGANLNNSRGVKTANYMVLRDTNCPASLVEFAFIDNLVDIQCVDETHEQKAFGVAITKGILKALNISYISDQPKKYYIITNYIPQGEYGIEINSVLKKYFDGLERIYIKTNGTGLWLESQYVSKEQAQLIADKLSADGLLWKLVEE